MERVRFEQLLYEEESPTLDFKQKQYPFAKASEEEKSELLKDLLGFANAWRRSEAYILIGVEEVRGAQSNVVGIAEADHLDDHSLQQFVNNLTQRPLQFHYEAFGYEGKQIGILRIEQQEQGIYLKRDYGRLQKEKVYVRRGSSTDPSKPASIDEIKQMGRIVRRESADVKVEFCDTQVDRPLGQQISWDANHFLFPPKDQFPDLAHPRSNDPFGIATLDTFYNRLNPDYYRELAEYVWAQNLMHELRIVVRNAGKVAAENVRCELEIRPIADALAMDIGDFPTFPSKQEEIGAAAIRKGFRRVVQQPGDLRIDKDPERIRIEIECGDLQPGRPVWSEKFYLGKGKTGRLVLEGIVYASNLPEPQQFQLIASIDVSEKSLSAKQFVRMEKGLFSKDD